MAYTMFHPGTIALTNASTAIVGTGTDFTRYVPGDRLVLPGIGGVTIQTITDALNAVATTPWAGATVSGAAYDHDPMITGADVAQRMRDLIETLGNGNLQSLASQNLVADKLAYGSGTNTFGLTGLTAFARTLLDDVDAPTARGTLKVQPTAAPVFTGTLKADGLTYTSAINISSQDLNALTVSGIYNGNSLVNSPDGSADWFYVEVIRHSNANGHVLQRAATLASGLKIFVRWQQGNVWGAWYEMATDVSATFCVTSVQGGWQTFTANLEYGVLPANGSFLANSGGFYAGAAVNGFLAMHVPKTGKYLCNLQAYFTGSSVGNRLTIKINGTTPQNLFVTRTSADIEGVTSASSILVLNKGDYITQGDVLGSNLYLFHAAGHTQLSMTYLGV